MRRWPLAQAAKAIAAGGIIAYPTEAVYGLGCDPMNPAAVLRLLTLKQRRLEKGLILIAAELDQLLPYIAQPTIDQLQLIGSTWPGPTTWLLPKRPEAPPWICGQFDTVAVRVTRHPIAAALCRYSNSALISTSANRKDRHPARSRLGIQQQFGNQLDYILTGPVDCHARPTEIRDVRDGRIIRPG